VLDRPEAQADPQTFAAALVTATIAARYANIAAALRLGEQAIKLARHLDNDRLLIESLAALSAAWYYAGKPKRGLPPGREAVQRARRLGDDVLLGHSLADFLLCDALIDPVHARPLFTQAIACTQRSGDHLVAYFLNNSAAVLALRAGDISAARAHLDEAAQARQAVGGQDLSSSINMGWVLRQDNDPDGARSSFEAVLRISRRNGDRYGIAYASLGLACLAADAADWHRAAVGGSRSPLPPGQSRSGARPPGPGTVRAGPRRGHGAHLRPGPRPDLRKDPPRLILPSHISARYARRYSPIDHDPRRYGTSPSLSVVPRFGRRSGREGLETVAGEVPLSMQRHSRGGKISPHRTRAPMRLECVLVG